MATSGRPTGPSCILTNLDERRLRALRGERLDPRVRPLDPRGETLTSRRRSRFAVVVVDLSPQEKLRLPKRACQKRTKDSPCSSAVRTCSCPSTSAASALRRKQIVLIDQALPATQARNPSRPEGFRAAGPLNMFGKNRVSLSKCKERPCPRTIRHSSSGLTRLLRP